MEAAPLRAEAQRRERDADAASSLGLTNVRGGGYYH
jgi:hypothetical protein